MTSGSHTSLATLSTITVIKQPQRRLRLRLKPKAPTSGHVDGAWWPHSYNLSAESPELLAVLATRLGPIERITHNLTTWHADVRRVSIGGHAVRLGGFRSQPADTVTVIGTDQQRLTLLVVPPETEHTAAHRMLMSASQPGNADSIDILLERG